MKITFLKKTLVALILICTTAFAVQAKKFCEGTGSTTDGTLSVWAVLSWSVGGSDCCSPTAGSAFVQKTFYVNGQYFSTSSYYISISDAQYSMGCQYI